MCVTWTSFRNSRTTQAPATSSTAAAAASGASRRPRGNRQAVHRCPERRVSAIDPVRQIFVKHDLNGETFPPRVRQLSRMSKKCFDQKVTAPGRIPVMKRVRRRQLTQVVIAVVDPAVVEVE